MTETRLTDIRQLKKLRDKYAPLFSYIALLTQEFAKQSARLEELRKKEAERRKKESARTQLEGLNFHTVIIDEIAGNTKIGENQA